MSLNRVVNLLLSSWAVVLTPAMVIAAGGSSPRFDIADYPVGVFPTSVAVGDLDGDRSLDLAVANRGVFDPYGGCLDNGSVSVLFNNGDGTFAPDVVHDAGDFPESVAVSDLDGDLDLDLAVANFGFHSYPYKSPGDVSVLLNNGDGTFARGVTYEVGEAPDSIVMGDLDGDLDVDLAVANRFSDDVSVLLNNGDGTFEPDGTYGAGGRPASVAVGDLDGDLDLDLAVANAMSNSVSVLLNDGKGAFAADVTYDAGDGPEWVAVGDLDGDLDLDLAVANRGTSPSIGNDVSVLLNNGDGTFAADVTYIVGDNPSSVVAGDLDGDLDLDLTVANFGSDNVTVLLNQGDGTFLPQMAQVTMGRPIAVAVSDLDGDKVLDLTVAGWGRDYYYKCQNLLSGSVTVLLTESNTCPGDTNGDGQIEVLDLVAVVVNWGQPGGSGDVNRDGIVDVQDLVLVIAMWGPCR